MVTCNLAATFVSEPEGNVLLLDTSPGGQRLSAAFGAASLPGLYTYIEGRPADLVDPDEVLSLCRKTKIRRLQLLPSGELTRAADSPFLQAGLTETHRVLTEYFRLVFLDAPPILEDLDVAVFAAVPDAVLLVVEAGVTSRADLARTAQLLHGSGANLLGCILCGAKDQMPSWLRRLLMGPSG
jgi:Mrp family chromosome partitioning ATPase